MSSCEFPQDSVFGNTFPFILPQYYSNFECTPCLITRFVLQIQNGPSDCKVQILSQNSIDPEVIRTCSVDPLPREIFFLKNCSTDILRSGKNISSCNVPER